MPEDRWLLTLAFDFDAHAAGGTFNHPNSLIDAACVEVSHFLFSDILALVTGDLGYLSLVRNTTALCDAGCLL